MPPLCFIWSFLFCVCLSQGLCTTGCPVLSVLGRPWAAFPQSSVLRVDCAAAQGASHMERVLARPLGRAGLLESSSGNEGPAWAVSCGYTDMPAGRGQRTLCDTIRHAFSSASLGLPLFSSPLPLSLLSPSLITCPPPSAALSLRTLPHFD